MNFEKIKFSNGLRLILVPDKNINSVTVLALVKIGSRDETAKNNGVSHFLEHMVFKGTEKRPSPMEVVETLDKIGAKYNAFTDKEFTGYYAKVDNSHLRVAIDWVSDLIISPILSKEDFEREKDVIIEEIKMYLDTPMSYISDLWEKLLYGKQPLGRFIIGSENGIKKMKVQELKEYYKTNYSTKNIVVIISGNFKKETVKKLAKKYFSGLKKKKIKKLLKTKENQNKISILNYFKKTDQTHFCLGVRAYDLFHKDKYVLDILSVILGGNMSSRLFSEIREKRGLAYYVHTSLFKHLDVGNLFTQAGIAHKNLEQVINIIIDNYNRLKTEEVFDDELKKAKDYLKGFMKISIEGSEAKANYVGIQEALTNKIVSLEKRFKKIDKVSKLDIKRVANDIFKNQNLNLAIIGPHKIKKYNFKKLK